jgi:RHS repeat-associated protein
MDASGSTMALTGAAGATNQTTTLDPWGAVESQTGTSGNRELFTGHRTDSETGLVYMGARYYDPALGQFTTADSYLGEPSEPGSMQRYMYANANPGRYWDPDGHLADELASGTSMSWGEYSATDGGNSNAAYQPLQTESVVGADVTGYRAALTSQINSGARDMIAVASKEIRGLDWNRALWSLAEGAAVGAGVGAGLALAAVLVCMGPIGFALAVVGATTLVVNVMVPGLAASAYRAYDDYQNAAASGSDHPLFRAMAVTLGRSTGLTEGYEALTGRDAVTDRALTMDERDDRLAESANSVGGELGAGVGAFAVRRTLGTGFCFVAGTLVAMTSTAYAQPIEDVRVGDRVEVTSEQESTCSHEAREDQVRVSFVFANERASWDTVYLDKLVSRDEAESLGYEVGASVWVDGTDFGAAGWAQVSAVEPVHVEAGAGCVVYATVEHQNGELVRVDLSDGSEVLGTAGHRYWSVTRGGWFEARELREGEALRTPSGVVHVTSSLVIDALAPVFNIEVEGAHEYFVGEGEVLVHNGIDCDPHNAASHARLREQLAHQEANPPRVRPPALRPGGHITHDVAPHGNLSSQRNRAPGVTGRFDLVRAHQFLVVAPAPHCRAHVAERVRCRRSRMTETRLTERPRRALSTAKGVACVRPKWLPVVMEQPYCNQSAMPLSDACGTARKSPSQRHAARGLVAMSDVSTCRVALANAAA